MSDTIHTGTVRADSLQRVSLRSRVQARLNIRAGRMPTPVQAYVHGFGLLALTPLSPPEPVIEDGGGGAVLISKTTLGNWSSDGNDTAPLVGPWLMLEKVDTTEILNAEADESTVGDLETVSVALQQWVATFWEDGAQDIGFDWRSEKIQRSAAEDLFAFRVWAPFPDTGTDHPAVWFQPIEPAAAGGGLGMFAFEIVGDDLICSYSGTTAPDLAIDGSGDLILTL